MFKDMTILVSVVLAISLGFVLIGNPLFALLAVMCAAGVCIAIVHPSLLIIVYFFYAPFMEYIRYLFPAEINIGGKIFILSGSAKEILFFLVISSFLYRKFILKTQDRNKNISYYLFLILLIWLFINIFRNDNPIDGLWQFRNYLYAFGFYFIGYYFIHDKNTVMRIIKAFLLSGVILTVVGLIQIFHDRYFIVSPELLIGYTRPSYLPPRITSLLSNPNALGTFLVIAILFGGALYLCSNSKFEKILLIILSLAATLVVFYTLSRESWLALVGGICILSILFFKNKKYMSIVFLLICIIIILNFLPPYFFEHFSTIGPSGGISRIIMWKTISSSISSDLLWGSGTGSMGSVGSYGLNVIRLKSTGYAVADNAYLRILVEGGIIGLLLLLILCFFIGKDILLSLKAMDQEFSKAIPLCAILIFFSLLITGFFADSIFGWLVSPIFWLISGYIGSYIYASNKMINITRSESLA